MQVLRLPSPHKPTTGAEASIIANTNASEHKSRLGMPTNSNSTGDTAVAVESRKGNNRSWAEFKSGSSSPKGEASDNQTGAARAPAPLRRLAEVTFVSERVPYFNVRRTFLRPS